MSLDYNVNCQAGRFYVKAIASYEEALQRNPQSFDASYNRYDINSPILPARTEKGGRKEGEKKEKKEGRRIEH